MTNLTKFQKRSFDSGRHFQNEASLSIDYLAPRGHQTIKDPYVNYRQELYTTTSDVLGTNISFILPDFGNLVDLISTAIFDQTTTASYSQMFHTNAHDTIKCYHGGKPYIELDNIVQIVNSRIPTLTSSQQAEVITLAGGLTPATTSADQYTSMILPLPISHFWFKCEPFPLRQGYKSKNEIKIKFKAGTDLIDTGATGYATSSYECVAVMMDYISEVLSQNRTTAKPIYTFYPFVNRKSAVTTATTTAVQLSNDGITAHFSIIPHLSSDITANEEMKNKALDEVTLYIDGLQHDVYTSAREARCHALIQGYQPNSSTGYITQVAVGNLFNTQKPHYTGGYELSSFKSFELRVKHSLGADADIDIVSFVHCMFKYSPHNIIKRIT